MVMNNGGLLRLPAGRQAAILRLPALNVCTLSLSNARVALRIKDASIF